MNGEKPMFYNNTVKKLTARFYRNTHQIDRVIKAKHFIDQNFNQPLSLDTISNAVHVSKFHLNREFKRLYGLTPAQHLKEKRISEAKKILANHGSVSDACYSVGYESLSTFSLLFRRMTGKNAAKVKSARMNK